MPKHVRLCLVFIGLIASGPLKAADLQDFITDLYGGDGIFLPAAPGIPSFIAEAHQPHFTGEQQIQELSALSDGILSGAGIFALNSTVTGVSFDLSSGVPQAVQDSLGPLLTERATTLGEGRWTLGFGYTNQDFKKLDGDKLSDISITLSHQDCCAVGPPPIPPPDGQLTGFETDTIQLDIDIDLKQEVFALFSNYGVTNRFDIGIVVPIVRVEARASSIASIVPGGEGSTIGGNPVHSFETDPDLAFDETGGTETGIGDVLLRAKYRFMDDASVFADFAVLFDVTLPTGDEKDLLGTGETQFRGVAVLSKNMGRVTRCESDKPADDRRRRDWPLQPARQRHWKPCDRLCGGRQVESFFQSQHTFECFRERPAQ
jgi:hypothetical protein